MKKNTLLIVLTLLALPIIMGAHLASNFFGSLMPRNPSCGTYDCSLMQAGGRMVHKQITLNGDGAQTDNLFTVTGQVRVLAIYMTIDTATNCTDLADVKFETDDAGAQDDITGVVDMSSCVAGGLAYRNAASGTALAYASAAAGGISESATNKVNFEFELVQKTGGVTTYVRISFNGNGDTNVVATVYIRYQPLTALASVDAV